MDGRVRWVLRGAVLLLLAGLCVFSWHEGLSRASAIATVVIVPVTIAVAVAPLFLPEKQQEVKVAPMTHAAPPTPAQAPPGAQRPKTGAVTPSAPTAVSAAAPAATTVPVRTVSSVHPVSMTDLRKALLRFPDMDRPAFRTRLLRDMGTRLGLDRPFETDYSNQAREHVFAITDAIWAYRAPDEARRALLYAMEQLRPNDAATDQLRDLIAQAGQ